MHFITNIHNIFCILNSFRTSVLLYCFNDILVFSKTPSFDSEPSIALHLYILCKKI